MKKVGDERQKVTLVVSCAEGCKVAMSSALPEPEGVNLRTTKDYELMKKKNIQSHESNTHVTELLALNKMRYVGASGSEEYEKGPYLGAPEARPVSATTTLAPK